MSVLPEINNKIIIKIDLLATIDRVDYENAREKAWRSDRGCCHNPGETWSLAKGDNHRGDERQTSKKNSHTALTRISTSMGFCFHPPKLFFCFQLGYHVWLEGKVPC